MCRRGSSSVETTACFRPPFYDASPGSAWASRRTRSTGDTPRPSAVRRSLQPASKRTGFRSPLASPDHATGSRRSRQERRSSVDHLAEGSSFESDRGLCKNAGNRPSRSPTCSMSRSRARAPRELAPALRALDAPAVSGWRVCFCARVRVLLDTRAVAPGDVRARVAAPERLVVEVTVRGADEYARHVARTDERVRRARRAVHEVPGAEVTLLVLDDQDAFAHQDEEVLLHRLRVVHVGRPPRPEYAQDESRARLDVLAEIRPAAQDEVVGLEDAAGLRLIVVHPRRLPGVDNEPPRRHGREAGLDGHESCFFNHWILLEPARAACAQRASFSSTTARCTLMRALLPRTKEATGDAAASGSSPSRVDEPARPGKTVSSGGRERRLPPPLHLQFMLHRG